MKKMVVNIFNQLSPFSFSEKVVLIKYRLGKLLLQDINKDVRACYHLTSKLIHQGVKIKKKGNSIFFNYPINGNLIKFNLNRISSDIHVFQQIVIKQEYQALIDVIEKSKISLNVMVDAGANIGLTTLFFKSFYPNVNIIALEPSENTYERMVTNINENGFENISLLKKGLWSHKTKLIGNNEFRDGLDWSFRLIKPILNEEALIEVCSMSDILFEYKLTEIDFLKIDIEGAESEIFKRGNEFGWLKKVKIIAMEIHNEFNCRETIHQILIEYNFALSFSGELTIAVNKSFIN